MVGNAQTDIITILVPLSVEELFAQVQGLLCQFCSRCSRCSGLVLIGSLCSSDVVSLNALCLCIVDQSVCQRRYTTQVAVAIANDGAGQVVVILVLTGPCLRLTRPDQTGRDGEGLAVISYTLCQIRYSELGVCGVIRFILCRECLGCICSTQDGVVHEPAYPAIQNLFQSLAQLQTSVANHRVIFGIVRLHNIVQFSQTLYSPYLVTDPVVGTRVSIYRVFQISHVVECGHIRRILFITSLPGVSAAAGDRTILRHQPQVQFHLSAQRLLEVLSSALCLHACVQIGVIYQCISNQRILVEFVAVRCTDLPCPGAVHCAAPGGVPVHQIMLAIIRSALLPLILAADFLVVLIVHIITGIITHLTSQCGDRLITAPLGVNSLIAYAPSVCIINSLDCTVFCVRCVGIRPLFSRSSFGVEEALHTAVASDTIGLVQVGTSVRDSFPAGFLLAALEGVDQCELTAAACRYSALCALRAVYSTKAIPVIYVCQPVHQVQSLITAVLRAEALVDRVLCGIALRHIGRVHFNLFPLIAVSSAQLTALLHEVATLLIRDHGCFHGLPSLSQVADSLSRSVLYVLYFNFTVLCSVYDVITHCCGPYQVGQCFRSCFVTIVRSLDTQIFYRVIRDAQTVGNGVRAGHIAVLYTVGNNVIVQGHKALCIGLVAVCLVFGSGTSGSRCSGRQNCRASHCSSQNSSQKCFAFLELHSLGIPLSER